MTGVLLLEEKRKRKKRWKHPLRVGLCEWIPTAVPGRHLTPTSGNWLRFHTSAAPAAGLTGDEATSWSGADSCSRLFIQTQRDGDVCQVANAWCHYQGDTQRSGATRNYAAASCLNGWAGAKITARPPETPLSQDISISITGFLFAGVGKVVSPAHSSSTRGGEKTQCWCLTTPTECLCEIKNIMMDFVPVMSSFQCPWRQKVFRIEAFYLK